MEKMHVIWGDIEPTSNSSSELRESGSYELSAEQPEDGPRRSGSRREPREDKLPSEVQRYLNVAVAFNDDSGSGQGSTPASSAEAGEHRPGPGRRTRRPQNQHLVRPTPTCSDATLANAAAAALDVAMSRSILGSTGGGGGGGRTAGQARCGQRGPQEKKPDREPQGEEDGLRRMTEEEFEALPEAEKQALLEMMMDNDEDEDQEQSEVDQAELQSLGSAKHGTGKCRPCRYFYTNVGCVNGKDCSFCHFPHEKKSRPRPCKTKRLQCKKFISMLEDVKAKDPSRFNEAMQTVPDRSNYVQAMLKRHMKTKDGQVGKSGDPGGASTLDSMAAPQQPPTGTRKKNLVSL